MLNTLDMYIRILAASIWLLLGSFIAICLLPFAWKNPSLGYYFARFLNRPGLFFLGLKTEIHGAEHLLAAQPCVYLANHQSNLDIITLSSTYCPRTVVIGKKELKWIPLFGLMFAGAGNIMIDRKDRVSALSGLDAAAEAVRAKRLSVWIFPEGTRNRGRAEMLPFKKGAFHLAIKAQIPIVPIVNQHLLRYFDHENHRLIHGQTVHIRVLEPIPTAGLTLKDLDTLMTKVRSRMEEALQDPRLKPLAKPPVLS